MPDMYEFAVNEEELAALINELLGKTTTKIGKKTEQADARAALSDIIGIDLDKLAALVNDETTDNETADNNEADINTDNDTADILANDLFRAKAPNGLEDVYKAGKFNTGAVISINDVEHFHITSVHNDNTTFWIDAMGRILSEEDMAQYARGANSVRGAVVTKIIHFG